MDSSFVSLRVVAPNAELAERAAAEVFAAGASGLEERPGRELVIYSPVQRAAAVRGAAMTLVALGLVLGEEEPVEPVDWSRRWRDGLRPVEISPRLVVRPSFLAGLSVPGQAQVVIDPGQAFGTGGHASTRIALELLDALPSPRCEGVRVLDVGCGSGVLALSALRLGAARAVAFDLDPLAGEATRDNARVNGLEGRIGVFVGSFDALGPGGFELVLANLLRSELEPLLPRLASALVDEGVALLSGLLVEDRERIEAALAEIGLSIRSERNCVETGGDRWIGLEVGR